MGIQKGGVHISGKFADVQYYTDGMQGFVRGSNPPSKEKIMKSPAYDQFRKNMWETAGASRAADLLQRCFGEGWQRFGERYLRAHIVKKLRDIVKNGSGFKGERRFEVTPNLARFKGFELSKTERLTEHFPSPFSVSTNPDRNTAILDVPAFDWNGYTGMPSFAKYGRLFMTIGVLSDFMYVGGEQVYESSQPDFAGLRARGQTLPIPPGAVAGFQLTVSLPGAPILPSDCCLVVCVGVQYLDIVNNREEIFQSCDAMQIYGAF